MADPREDTDEFEPGPDDELASPSIDGVPDEVIAEFEASLDDWELQTIKGVKEHLRELEN